MPKRKDTLESLANGCPVYNLVGAFWLCQPDILQAWVDTAWAIVESGELKAVQLRSSEQFEEQEERPYTLQNGIARVLMSGPMTKYQTSFSSLFGGVAMQHMREVLREVRNNPDVRGVFIDADSHGGTAEGTSELADAIRKTAASKPLHVHAEDKACSGMLWVATQGGLGNFTAGPAASVGSQGTILKLVDSSAIAKSSGLKPVIIATGPYKAIGAPGVELTKEHIAELERYVRQVNEPFKQAVITARRLSPENTAEVATARVFVGDDAKRVGLIDRVCSADEAYEAFAERVHSPTKVTSGPVRGHGSGVQSNAAPERRIGMLTPEQLAEVQKLPGAAGVTAENADVFLLGVAKSAIQTSNSLQSANGELQQKLSSLSQKVPATIDPKVAEGTIKLFGKELDLAVKAGVLTPEQAAIFKDGLTAANVSPEGGVLLSADKVTKALELNKPNGLVKEQSGGQPAPRTEPGAKQDDQPTTPARKAELLGLVGYEPTNGNGQH
jgi:signal peptide peptidase SppA